VPARGGRPRAGGETVASQQQRAALYLGLDLPHPLMPGASPLVNDLDTVGRLKDAGAAAIVMHSLFEEQIAPEEHAGWMG
jgi:hypothetical protein